MFRGEYHEPSLFPAWLTTLFYILVLLFIVGVIFRIIRGWLPLWAYGNWAHVFKDADYSKQDFYDRFEKKLKASKINDITFSWEDFHEGAHFVSPKRRYRKVQWRDKLFYVCIAPYGDGFFVSWWHFELTPMWERILLLLGPYGKWVVMSINPMTFYRLDTAAVFQRYMHDAVVESMDEISKTQGFSFDGGKKPELRNPYDRK